MFSSKEVLIMKPIKGIRRLILENYQKSRKLLSLEAFATKNGLTYEELLRAFRREPKLKSLHGLSPSQADKLIEYYGSSQLFTASLEKLVRSFLATRTRIEEIERKARKQRSSD